MKGSIAAWFSTESFTDNGLAFCTFQCRCRNTWDCWRNQAITLIDPREAGCPSMSVMAMLRQRPSLDGGRLCRFVLASSQRYTTEPWTLRLQICTVTYRSNELRGSWREGHSSATVKAS